MEELSVIKPLSQSASGAARPSTPSTPSQKSSGSERKVVNATAGTDNVAVAISSGKPSASLAEVDEAVSTLNNQLAIADHALRFKIDKTTDEIKVLVVDEETGKVVRTIPPEASVRLAANGQQSGIFTVQG